MQRCAACGSPAIALVDSQGGEEGGFVERYECEDCGALGTIRGDTSDPPRAWSRTGRVFEALDAAGETDTGP